MMELITTIAFAMLGVAMVLAIVRVVLGPSLADRILGLDMATTLGIGIIATFAARVGISLYIDVAVALALVGFLSTAAFARYLLTREVE